MQICSVESTAKYIKKYFKKLKDLLFLNISYSGHVPLYG